MCVCVCVVGGLIDQVQSTTETLPRPQISPPMKSRNVFTKPPTVPPPVSIPTLPSQPELSAPRIQWVSGWRERAAEEDGTDSEDGGMERWMEKYWGLRDNYTLSEDEKETDEEMQSSSEERWRDRADVEKRNEDEGESDEELESDLGSLRELGSEDEWEPFRRLQILCGSERRHGGDEWSEMEDECTPSAMTSELNLNTSINCAFMSGVHFLIPVSAWPPLFRLVAFSKNTSAVFKLILINHFCILCALSMIRNFYTYLNISL